MCAAKKRPGCMGVSMQRRCDAESMAVNRPLMWAMAFLASALLLTAWPAQSDEKPAPAAEDPLEPVNRFTSDFNRLLRGALIDPLVDGYQAVTPEPVQVGVYNVFSNLSEPATAISSLLQGDTENAGNATGRFLINSTIGFAGLSDEATGMGYEQRREDLGQAFGANGVQSGPHLVLPILGPTNFRDLTGDVVTGLVSPLPLAAQFAGGTVEYSSNQDTIRSIDTGAVDPYVAEREAYEQNRVYEISNGTITNDADFPSFASGTDGDLADKPK